MAKALVEHTIRFYKELEKLSTLETYQSVQNVRVFRGKVVDAFQSLGISQSYYTRVRKSLLEMGCITILQQGSRNNDSIIVLHREPTRNEFKQISEQGLTRRLDAAILSQRVDDIAAQLGGINIVDAMVSFEKRLRDMQQEIDALKQVRPVPTRKSTQTQ